MSASEPNVATNAKPSCGSERTSTMMVWTGRRAFASEKKRI